MTTLGSNRYGKEKVRVLRKLIDGDHYSIVEISADVLLEGNFERSYLSDDNTQVVATDTVKNTIIALAHQHLGPCIEDFAKKLGAHFLSEHPQVQKVHIELREKCWERMPLDGVAAPHSFRGASTGVPYTQLVHTRDGLELKSGIRELLVLNATNSAFENFDHTRFTTLQDAGDRILSTVIDAQWTYGTTDADFRAANERILHAALKVFVENFSPSVQRTLFEMGEAVLCVAPEITSIRIALPNKHYFLADLSPFGMENPNLTFTPQDAPHGQIEATVRR